MFSRLLNNVINNFVLTNHPVHDYIRYQLRNPVYRLRFFISESIEHHNRNYISIELNESELKYQQGGLNALNQELNFEVLVSGDNLYFVRVVNNQNETIYLNIPEHRDSK